MCHDVFRQPVLLMTEAGRPTLVDSVGAAQRFLDGLRRESFGADLAVALNACRAARNGEIDAETARATLAAFARRASLLVAEESLPGPNLVLPASSPAIT